MAAANVVVEGGLFPADLLDRIARGDSSQGQRPQDFELSAGARLSDELQGAFSDVRAYFDAYARRRAHSHESDTTLTRQALVIPVLERLGFGDLDFQRALQAGGENFAISHSAGQGDAATPIHVVAYERPLDARADGAKRSPRALVQEYLNRSDALWGLVTNGATVRLLRDSARLAQPTYLEFNLGAMAETNAYSDFVLLYRLLHRTRFPSDGSSPNDCLLERYYQQGLDEGSRVREHLRDGVERALQILGTALLGHAESKLLRDAVASGQLADMSLYRELLNLVYRLLFLMVIEERKLVFPPDQEGGRTDVYGKYYSVTRLRERCERHLGDDRHADLWQGLCRTFELFRDDDQAHMLGLGALDGELFGIDACRHLERAGCANADLLRTLHHLSTFWDGKARRRVNYAGLDVEELGSVYESLLEYRPHVELGPAPRFLLLTGSVRKTTGSYYTPPSLVHELIESALVPVLQERLAAAKGKEAQEAALLGLRVVDPASGSGHFLLAAARRIGRELARVRTGDVEPSPDAYRLAVRDVIRQCVYAVDRNPLAVDLCKVALWLEGHNSGLPLSFLDHHVKCGDSLTGVFDLGVLQEGIPDDAYAAVTGDDKQAATSYKRQNKQEREGHQTTLSFHTERDRGTDLAADFAVLAELPELSASGVHAKADLYRSLHAEPTLERRRQACHLWTYAFFAPLQKADYVDKTVVPTTDIVRQHLGGAGHAYPPLVGPAIAASATHPYFHWPLEFPEVFPDDGPRGFDVVLGNPPWERIKLQEEEFFAGRDPEIAHAKNKAERQKLIAALPKLNPALFRAFDRAKHDAEAQSKFLRASERYPLCGRGDINTYAVFAETMRNLVGQRGRAGVIVPSGIATDDTTKHFFHDLAKRRSLASLYDFENRDKLFPAVDSRMKFCLLTLSGDPVPAAQFVCFATRTEHLKEPERRFTLTPEEIALLNPNTSTLPVFRTREDAELTKSIYRRVPVLVNERTGENPWGVRFATMFHMSNDSHLFHDAPGAGLVPLYEGRLGHQFNHRYAVQPRGEMRAVTAAELRDPHFRVTPQYWVAENEIQPRLARRTTLCRSALLGFRRVARNTDERSVIATMMPWGAVSYGWILCLGPTAPHLAVLIACFNALVFDYVARNKLSQPSIPQGTFEQLPALPALAYTPRDLDVIVPRVLELTYTAWDLQPFARDLGYDGPPFAWDPDRRAVLRAELDASFAALYGLTRDELRYILDPSDVEGPDFPGETFRVLKEREIKEYGEYRTRRLVLEAWDRR
jgi:hypothetical protein